MTADEGWAAAEHAVGPLTPRTSDPRIRTGPAGYIAWHDTDDDPLRDANDLVRRYGEAPIMHFAEFEIDGVVRFDDGRVLAELFARYIHDDTGDNDRPIQLAVLPVRGGWLWIVADLLVHPETAAAPDPDALRTLCAIGPNTRRETVDEVMLGPG